MYTNKFVQVKHSGWTGKPKESIEGIIEEHTALGWRFVQVFQDSAMSSYSGKYVTKIVFEKEVSSDFYSQKGSSGIIDEDSFV